MTSPTTVYSGQDVQVLLGKIATTNYYYQARSVLNDQASAWEPASAGVLGKASSAAAGLSAAIYPGSASSSGIADSQTTGSVTVTPSGGTAPYTYAWTWASGGASITITSATAATTTFSAATLAIGETRSGQARCTVTDNVSATYTIDASVSIARDAVTITVPNVGLFGGANAPADASVAFRVDADGHWYSSGDTSPPAYDQGAWVNYVSEAGNYEIKCTRTGGTQTDFTSGPAIATYHALTSDREWRLTHVLSAGYKNILFTIDIRLIAGPGTPVTGTGRECNAEVFPEEP
jgi:hypothetical protein